MQSELGRNFKTTEALRQRWIGGVVPDVSDESMAGAKGIQAAGS